MFRAPDFICHACAKDAHRAAQTQLPTDLDDRRFIGACAACGDCNDLLPAHLFGLAAPSKAAHRFAAAVVEAWCGQSRAEHMNTVHRARARSESGQYWVEFKPAGSAFIHTEAICNPAEAIARFIQAASC
jgi:hypothetical protein